LPFALREAQTTVILRLALRLDKRRVAFIDGGLLSSLSAKTQTVHGDIEDPGV
jgi:hypothetical protein